MAGLTGLPLHQGILFKDDDASGLQLESDLPKPHLAYIFLPPALGHPSLMMPKQSLNSPGPKTLAKDHGHLQNLPFAALQGLHSGF